MNKKVFLSALLVSLVLPMVSLTGCSSVQYRDKTKVLNKTTLGEASINNISKYSAIGVGKLDKLSLNKKYRLITNQSNDEVDNSENEQKEASIDLSNTLIGLTNDGVLEELSLTIQNGQQLNSSAFNITYYQEIGDFVLISMLPMNATDYVDGIVNNNHYSEIWDDNGNRTYLSTKDCVSSSIDRLCYPLKYSIRYYNSQEKEYEYIDTSYLIHKRSGKLFPFSSRKYCVDSKKCKNGEFVKPSVIVEGDEVDNYPINGLLEYFNFNGAEYLDSGWGFNEEAQTFTNGFYTYVPTNHNINIDDESKNTCDFGSTKLYIVIFNNESSTLEITNMRVKIRDQGWWDDQDNVISTYEFYDHYITIDRFGNFLCKYKERTMSYNVSTKSFTRVDTLGNRGVQFDRWTKQYYYRDAKEIANNDGWTEYRDYYVFLDDKFEEDYYRDIWNCFRVPMDNSDNSFLDNILERQQEFLERSEPLGDKERIVFTTNKIIKFKLDENRHYLNESPTIVLDIDGNFIYHDNEYCYYFKDLIVHKVAVSNNYESFDDDVYLSLANYPFVESVWYVGNGIIGFTGMDNQLNTITGYMHEDGTVTYEIEEFDVGSNTTILSPIN